MRLGWTVFWGSRLRRPGGGTFGAWLGRGMGREGWECAFEGVWGPEELYIVE